MGLPKFLFLCRHASHSDKGLTLGTLPSGLLLCHSLQLVEMPRACSEGVLRLETASCLALES